MRILSVSVVFPPAWRHGGTPVTAHAIAKAMIRQGHQVFAVCTGSKADGSPVTDRETEWDGVPVVYCSRRPFPMPFYSPALQREVAARVTAYDTVTIRSSWTHTGPAASRECHRKGVPYLAYPEGCFEPRALSRGRLKKRLFWHLLDKPFYQAAAAIVALTRSEADSVRRMGLTNRVEVIPNGVEIGELATGASRIELEDTFPELRGRPIVLFLSRIHPIKGLPNLIRAFKQIHTIHSDALLVIAGPDEEGHRKELECYVRQEGLGSDVLFTGPVFGETKIGLLRNSEIFVLPSYSEGFPVVVLEALACELPVILSKNCHVPEVAEAGGGIEIEASPRQIADALDMLLSDASTREQMGKDGYRLAAEHFTWNRVAKMTADLCRDVAFS